MGKPKFTAEQKVEIINAYREGRVAYSQIKEVYGIHPDLNAHSQLPSGLKGFRRCVRKSVRKIKRFAGKIIPPNVRLHHSAAQTSGYSI